MQDAIRRCLAPPTAALAVAFGCLGAFVPSDVRIATTDRTLSFSSDGRTISTATLCPGYVFDQFGTSGPTFSPDLHWVLVDVLGPFEPGNVARNHALVNVTTGAIVRSSEFPQYLGIPSTLDALAWASGERQTLRYTKGPDRRVVEEPLHPIPTPACQT